MDYPGKVISKNAVVPSQTSASGVWTLDDAAAAVESNTWPIAGVPNPISRSLRFNSADSAYLNRTFSTPTSGTTWTWSGWVKLGTIPSTGTLFEAGTGATNTFMRCTFGQVSAELNWRQVTAVGGLAAEKGTSMLFRDPSAWYHIVCVWDTSNATAADRQRVYVNGVQVTSFGASTNPSLNLVSYFNTASYVHYLGALNLGGLGGYLNGYLTEINFIDGQALDATSFGLTDPQTGAWIPKKYTGTYGTNGFYLNFSDNASTAALGTDYSGNNNTWTTNNFSVTAGAGNDSMTDVPTPWWPYNTTGDVGGVVRGNYATLNPLDTTNTAPTYANGNLFISAGAAWRYSRSTFALPVGVKIYAETTLTSATNGTSAIQAGFGKDQQSMSSTGWMVNHDAVGQIYVNGSIVASGLGALSAGAVIQFAWDGAGNGWIGKDNVWWNSTGGTTGNPSTGSNPTFTGMTGTQIFISTGNYSNSQNINFGQRPFAYTPPAGFLSLCTTNLPTPTIKDGSQYFDILLYTGDGTTSKNVTGLDFQPDMVYVKNRSAASDPTFSDVVRGITKVLYTDATAAESTAPVFGYINSVLSNGINVNSGGSTEANFNKNGQAYVAWNWKAGGTPAVTNTAGTITSTVSVNTTSGFSIVTYTGTGSAATVGHGLGVAPSMIITKVRSTSGADWGVYHTSIGNTKYLLLNTTAASATSVNFWNNTSPTSTVFSVGISGSTNNSGNTMVAYCFAPVAGYSAFGSYTGNGSTDGPFVFCGFRPRWILYKRTDTSGSSWVIIDTARDTYNYADKELYPNLSNAENTGSARIDILSNGYKIRSDSTYGYINASGGTYIYAAFAQNPFKYSNAR